MKFSAVADRIGARLLIPGRDLNISSEQIYAGDRISDLLNAAGEHALLVTNLASTQLMRMAELLDVPGLCMVNAQVPDEDMLRTAREHGTAIMVAPGGLFETCGRLFRCLCGEESAAP